MARDDPKDSGTTQASAQILVMWSYTSEFPMIMLPGPILMLCRRTLWMVTDQQWIATIGIARHAVAQLAVNVGKCRSFVHQEYSEVGRMRLDHDHGISPTNLPGAWIDLGAAQLM